MPVKTIDSLPRADLLLVALEAMSTEDRSRLTRPRLERFLQYLGDHGVANKAFDRRFARVSLRRTLLEALAYLDQNQMIAGLTLTVAGQEHLRKLQEREDVRAVETEVSKAASAVLPGL